MGEEFLTGYVNLAEGEKDPRNLLVAFAIARVLLIEFDVKHYIEVSISPFYYLRSLAKFSTATFQYHLLLLPNHLPPTT